MAMTGMGSSGEPLADINVTPFVDVMLVLLIIFMVTAPLIQTGVDVNLPQTRSTHAVAVKENDVVLTVDDKKQIFIGKNKIDMNVLSAKLKEIYKNKKEKELYLRADQKLPYGFVVKVMALVKNAGIDKMGMITDPET
jgi:biopolymer transport protein TolR